MNEGNWREVYARERLNQRCLGRAETAVILAANAEGVNVMEVGANEAKNEFGAQRKDAIARLVEAEFPHRFVFSPDNGAYLKNKITGEAISHHISDAAALAMVAARRLILEERITHCE